MQLEDGIFLGIIGSVLTVVGFYIAFAVGSKQIEPEEELTEVQKSLKDLKNVK